MATAVVTGGAGFIGHHIVAGLRARGDAVTIVDDLSSGRRERLAAEPGVRAVVGSVLDAAVLDEALAGADVVFHHAAVASVARSLDEPALVNEINVGGTIAVVEAAARQGVRRVVLASSSAVYGTSDQLPCREQQRPDPISPYGAGKLAAEHYLHALGAARGVETVALRYFNVFGPGQDPASDYAAVVPRFITAVAEGRSPVINGDGGITRDYIFVADVVRANLLAATGPSGLTCNIASGRETSLAELVRLVGEAAGRDAVPVIGPPRQGDILHSMAAVDLARTALGFEAQTPLVDGLRATARWFSAEAAASR